MRGAHETVRQPAVNVGRCAACLGVMVEVNGYAAVGKVEHEVAVGVGQLIYGELADDGRLNVVCVLDNDRIGQVPEDVFWSPRC